ncbi:MAG: hypothetical protein ACJ76I_11845 [Gaiellaceae bacterium]
MPVVLSPRALVTLEEVKAYMPSVLDDDPSNDPALIGLINSESREIYRGTKREFIAAAQDPRLYDVTAEIANLGRLHISDATSITTVQVLNPAGQLVATIAAPAYVELPRIREEWEPVTELWFRQDVSSTARLFDGCVVRVDATWGFPAVPDDIKHACKVFVARDFLRDLARHSRTSRNLDSDTQAGLARDVRKALDTIDAYRRSGRSGTITLEARP